MAEPRKVLDFAPAGGREVYALPSYALRGGNTGRGENDYQPDYVSDGEIYTAHAGGGIYDQWRPDGTLVGQYNTNTSFLDKLIQGVVLAGAAVVTGGAILGAAGGGAAGAGAAAEAGAAGAAAEAGATVGAAEAAGGAAAGGGATAGASGGSTMGSLLGPGTTGRTLLTTFGPSLLGSLSKSDAPQMVTSAPTVDPAVERKAAEADALARSNAKIAMARKAMKENSLFTGGGLGTPTGGGRSTLGV